MNGLTKTISRPALYAPGFESLTPQQLAGVFKFTNPQEQEDFMNLVVRAKGVDFNSVIGTRNVQVQLSGSARYLLGVRFDRKASDPNYRHRFTLMINNDQVFDNVADTYLSGEANGYSSQFIPFMRRLNGQDNILLTDRATVAAQDLQMVFYYK